MPLASTASTRIPAAVYLASMARIAKQVGALVEHYVLRKCFCYGLLTGIMPSVIVAFFVFFFNCVVVKEPQCCAFTVPFYREYQIAQFSICLIT
jgi:hypothetical protein